MLLTFFGWGSGDGSCAPSSSPSSPILCRPEIKYPEVGVIASASSDRALTLDVSSAPPPRMAIGGAERNVCERAIAPYFQKTSNESSLVPLLWEESTFHSILGKRIAKMLISSCCSHPTSGSTLQESHLQQKRFDNIL